MGDEWFFLDPRGKEHGPVNVGELKNQLKQGIITPSCMAWKDPSNKRPLGSIEELKGTGGPSVGPRPPGPRPPPLQSASSGTVERPPLPSSPMPDRPKSVARSPTRSVSPSSHHREVNAFDGSIPMPPSAKVVQMFSEYLGEKQILEYTRDACHDSLSDTQKWQILVLHHQVPLQGSLKNSGSLKEGLLYWTDMADSKKVQTLGYCTLRPGKFEYFKDRNDAKALGEIPINASIQVSVDPETLRPADPNYVFSFAVSFTDTRKKSRKFIFSAESEQGEAWLLFLALTVAADPEKNKPLGEDNVCFEMTLDMMMGIRYTVGKSGGQHYPAIATEKEFSEIASIQFPRQGSRETPPHKQRDFGFKDYCPVIFRRIRAHYGLDPAQYQMDVCGNFNYLEFVSNSKSGEFFFHSHCRKYMIKTVSHAECRCLFANMQHYYRHVMSNPNTILNKFFGLHKVKPDGQACNWFLIMGSVFPTNLKINRLFDLKGSTHGRRVKPQSRGRDGTVYKDLDFLEQKAGIDVGGQFKDKLTAQLKKDVDFLEGMRIIDYSVLMGMHYPGGYDPMHPYRNAETSSYSEESPDSPAGLIQRLCDKCGAQQDTDARFCAGCGARNDVKAKDTMPQELLEKEGGSILKRSRKTTKWKSRFMVLQNDRVLYFASQAAALTNSNPSVYLLADVLSVQVPARRKGEGACRFRLELRSGKRLLDLQSASKDICDDWVALLTKKGIITKDNLPQSPAHSVTFTCECGVKYEGFFCTNCGLPRAVNTQPEPGSPKAASPDSLAKLRERPPMKKPPEKQSKLGEWRRSLKELAPNFSSALEGLSESELIGLSEHAFVEKAGGNLLAKAIYKDLRAQVNQDRDAAFPIAPTRSKRVTLTCRNPELHSDLPSPVPRLAVKAPEGVQSEFAQYKGGIRGLDEEGVEVIYYVGIIDTLIEYNLKKKMERGYKANIKGLNPADFSVVEPPNYAQRLLGFIVPKIK